MITRHTNHLMDSLEQAYMSGCCVIPKQNLVLWYDAERVTKKVWRDIHEKWHEVSDGTPLLIGDGDGFWTIVYGKGLTTSKDSWLQDIRKWADIKDEAENMAEPKIG